MRPLAPTVLAILFVLVAGCGAPSDGPAPSVAQLSESDLLARALDEMPATFTARFQARTSAGQTVTMNGTFDAAANTTYVVLGGDPDALASAGGSAGAGSYLQHGLVFFQSPQATIYLANGSAFVKAPDEAGTRRVGTTIPTPEHGPLGALLRADALVRGFGGDDVRIVGANTTSWNGTDALEIALVNGTTQTSLVVTRTEPPRLVHVVTSLAPDPKRPPSALDHAALEGTLHYDASEILRPDDDATRALTLTYRPKKTGGTLTWEFVGEGNVRLDEVEVQVKRPPTNPNASGDPALLATAWTFSPAGPSRTVGNLTLVFHDADENGAVSRGDSLVAAGAEPFPPLVLYDLVTGVRIVPGGAMAVAATALLVAALLGRALRNVETRSRS